MGVYFTTNKVQILTFGFIFAMGLLMGLVTLRIDFSPNTQVLGAAEVKDEYWFLLHRKSNVELLYKGIPGNATQSALVKSFQVKTGEPGKKPTPLPQLFEKEYWTIIKKYETFDNSETAPYFIELDIPYSESEPYGPVPYLECNGQCNWELPGPFGLHGVNNDNTRLSYDSFGSSGCIRHTDSDIVYLYNLISLDDGIRYYIEDK